MTTKVENLIIEEKSQTQLEGLSIDELHHVISDLSEPNDIRLSATQLYFEQVGEEPTLELVNKFCLMYQFSGSSLLQKFLTNICMMETNLSSFLKATCAKSLLNFTEKEEIIEEDDEIADIKEQSNSDIKQRNEIRIENGYACLNKVCSSFDSLPTPFKVELLIMLVVCDVYEKQSLEYFCIFVNNQKIDCDYRYKVLLSLEDKIPDKGKFIEEIFLSFLSESANRTMYKILCGQYLLRYDNEEKSSITLSEEVRQKIQNIILSFAQDEYLDYNLRADAADMILNLGDHHNKIVAREIIMILGRTINSESISVFDNSQNVHTKEIEKSLLSTLEYLVKLPTYQVDNVDIDFYWIKEEILKVFNIPEPDKCVYDKCNHNKCKLCHLCICENEFEPYDIIIFSSLRETDNVEEYSNGDIDFCSDDCCKLYNYIDKVNISLNRIYLDRILYSKYSQTLLNILIKVASFIFTHEKKSELIIRLKEELYDMSGTCSTGFASRLINTLSGYNDFNIKISFSDQIVANFIGRINKRIQNICTNEEYYTTKSTDVVWIYMRNHDLIDYDKTHLTKDDLVEAFLQDNKAEKINEAVLEFSDNILLEMLERNAYTNRPYFIKFFRDTVPSLREELYQEFKDYVSDVEFDLSIRKAILNYESSEKFL